ncbi:MAG TPA: hypothetical protein VF628_11155 [Allosphingosinicella sp.]|jgi:hypothetical protein
MNHLLRVRRDRSVAPRPAFPARFYGVDLGVGDRGYLTLACRRCDCRWFGRDSLALAQAHDRDPCNCTAANDNGRGDV